MQQISYLKDSSFLDKLTKEKIKTVYTKIIVLDKDELPIETIQGKVTGGNINIQGNAAVRRTGSISFIVDEKTSNITDIDNIISINKKIRIFIGIENNINSKYEKIIWFPLGIFVMTQPSISHSISGISVNINFKDKMCLLNGECGGGLPTSITFHEYDQIIGYEEVDELPVDPNDYTIYAEEKEDGSFEYWQWDNNKGWVEGNPAAAGSIVSHPHRIFDIIHTLVIGYGSEAPEKVIINDIPLELKSSVRYTGSGTVYYSKDSSLYTLNQDDVLEMGSEVREFGYNEDIGYIYTDFTYPGELISGIGDNVTTVLDKIKSALGNYEYFYDIDGNFIFQEIKNYLNTSYQVPILALDKEILNNENYLVDFNNSSKSVYTFGEGSALVSSFSNTPNYLNIKNDFHVWGENDDGYVIHYHLAIKQKPKEKNQYYVVFLKNNNGEYTGQLRLATAADLISEGIVTEEELKLPPGMLNFAIDTLIIDNAFFNIETLYLANSGIILYEPSDWRAELYLQGLRKKSQGQRPDIYEQELLDMFDSIYDFSIKNEDGSYGNYKENIVQRPNSLSYYIDFLEPTDKLHNVSVDAIGIRKYSYQNDKINKLYNTDIPDNILINIDYSPYTRAALTNKYNAQGQSVVNVSSGVYDSIAIGTSGFTAQETVRELLYQYTDYNEAISIQSIPIYYLDANNRISVYDKASNIFGDYIIQSISLPLDAKGMMSISASRALERL